MVQVFLEQLVITQQIQKFSVMKPACSLLCSEESITGPYPQQLNPFHILTPCFFKAYFEIIFPSTPGSSKWSLILSFPSNNFVCISCLFMHATCHSRSISWSKKVSSCFLSATLVRTCCQQVRRVTKACHTAQAPSWIDLTTRCEALLVSPAA